MDPILSTLLKVGAVIVIKSIFEDWSHRNFCSSIHATINLSTNKEVLIMDINITINFNF
jgi:hypothetical protein